MYENELTHHGVLGMKWGVRRYQNADGSLTPRGKERFKQVRDSSFKSKRDTRAALRVYKSQKRSYLAGFNKNRYTKKAEKAKAKGNLEDAQKYTNYANAYDKIDKYYTKKINDIKSGTLKAGRDFIVQRDYDSYILSYTKTTRIIYK